MASHDLPPNTSLAPLLFGVIWGLTAVAAIIVTVRLFTSVTVSRKLSLADFLVTAALIFGIGCNAMLTVSAHFGLGRHIIYLTPKQLLKTLKYEVIAQPFGMLSPMFARVSFGIYLLQLVGPWKLNRSTLYLVIALQILVNSVSVVLFLSQCGTHVTALWNTQAPGAEHCLQRKVAADFDYFQGALNTLVDLVLTIIPRSIVIRLQLRPRIKVGLIFLLGLSLLAFVGSIIRTYKLSVVINSQDFTYALAPFAIWYNIENFVVIAAASIPTIRPLFTQHRNRQQGSSSKGPLSYGTSSEGAHSHENQSPAIASHGVVGAGTDAATILRSDTWEVSSVPCLE